MSENPIAVIFDLDGTLVDSAPDLTEALNYVLRRAGRPGMTIPRVRHLVGNGARAMIAKGFSESGTTPDDEAIEDILQDYLSYYEDNIADQSIIFPGVKSLLGELTGRGIPLGLCTNKSIRLARKLMTEIGLAGYFPVMTGGDSFDFQKPDPRHLTETLALMNCPASGAVMVGDTANDIIAARKAGMASIAVSFGYSATAVTSFNPNVVINHYRDFTDALSGISQVFQDLPKP